MPISTDHVGRSYQLARPYEVSAAKIAEFAKALQDDNPAYFADQPLAPPTFAALIAAQTWDELFGDPELGLDLNHTIHADQRFEYQRLLRAGDVVDAKLTIDKVRQRGTTDWVGISVELSVAGVVVGTASSTFLHSREASDV